MPWLTIQLHVVPLFMDSEDQRKLSQKHFDDYGAIPRLCIDLVKFPKLFHSYHTGRFQSALASLAITHLDFISEASQFDVDDNFYTLFIFRRRSVDDADFGTPHVFRRDSSQGKNPGAEPGFVQVDLSVSGPEGRVCRGEGNWLGVWVTGAVTASTRHHP